MSGLRVIENNQELRRYQLYERGDLAGFVQYSMRGEEIWLHYTQLKRRYKSEELIDELMLHVLDDVRRRRLAVMPFCPAMRTFLAARPEYIQLVPAPWQERFQAPLAASGVPPKAVDRVRYTGSPKRRSTSTREPQTVQAGAWPRYETMAFHHGPSAFSNGAPMQPGV